MTPTIFAIDPGCEQSAWLEYDPSRGRVLRFGKEPNAVVLDRLHRMLLTSTAVVIEQIQSYGMAVGREVFDTVFWAGRFVEAAGEPWALLPRREVKLHLCQSARAKDPNVRQALLDRWGGKEAAVGNKSAPGPLYGVSGDVWAALGVAVTWADTAPAHTTCPACVGMGCTECIGVGK